MAEKNLVIENAHLIFRNFKGEAGKYNPAGNRNFCVLLEDETAHKLEDDGWNIRWLKPRTEDEDPQSYLQVKVKYGVRPPKIVMITGNKKTVLDEDSINVLDWAELETADLVINPYHWEMNGKHGITAYLKTGYFTIVQDEFESKYENVGADSVYDSDIPF